jgi:hypothetical protein
MYSTNIIDFILLLLFSMNFLIVLGSTLRLVLSNRGTSTTDLLALVLGLLDGLTRLLGTLLESKTDKTVLGLELAEGILVVVDDAESGGLSTSVLGAESEETNELGIGLVHASDNFLKLGLGHIGTARMDDINNHLY